MYIASLAIILNREQITKVLIRLLGCSDRSVTSSLHFLLHVTESNTCSLFGDEASLTCICDDKFVMCYACKLTQKEVAAELSSILGVHLDTL